MSAASDFFGSSGGGGVPLGGLILLPREVHKDKVTDGDKAFLRSGVFEDTDYSTENGVWPKTLPFNSTETSGKDYRVKSLYVDNNVAVAVGEGVDGTEAAIQQSSDQGVTWNEQFYSSSGYPFNSVDGVEEDYIIAVGQQGNIYKSTDGGVSWTDKSGVTGNDLDIVACSGSVCVAMGEEVVFSTDKGETWSTSTDLTSLGTSGFDVVVTSNEVLVAVGTDIQRSTDNGDTFTITKTFGSGVGLLAGNDSYVIAANIGNTNYGYQSVDGGVTWESAYIGTNPDFLSLYNDIAIASANGVYLSLNGGGVWFEWPTIDRDNNAKRIEIADDYGVYIDTVSNKYYHFDILGVAGTEAGSGANNTTAYVRIK